ncbi:telomere repeats-binding bouquet formation protein 2 [Electrophorus electricus]|uniref:telomere repeats-binding bouquet formation protein 2 n=1 Tax=Electrophorus electricus TaxID=8005 RepID=UPI0015D0293B|nr:telomere repeats-binding bouquet formation protein 2 [Electrophorus electricus]
MFKNKTAWFSISVRTDISTFWVSHGGGISSWRAADYLFSDDASCPDTERIHTSEDYAMDRATVFHSAYLTTCKLRGSARSVPLGHYLLPPLSIQREIKSMIGRFIWEQNELSREAMPHGNGSDQQLWNFQPTDRQSLMNKGKISQENCMKISPPREESGCCEVQLYPVNNMDSGYVHIDQLKKYSGELHDFFPTCLGCSISTSHSRRHPYQHNER